MNPKRAHRNADAILAASVAILCTGAAAPRASAQPFFIQRTFGANLAGVTSIELANIDGAGGNDFVIAATSPASLVAWARNEGGTPASFQVFPINSTLASPSSVAVANIGGSGALDVIVTFSGANKVSWFEQGAGSPPTWTERPISSAVSGASAVVVADYDDDNDLDLFVAAPGATSIYVFENNGASPPVFTRFTVSPLAVGCMSLAAADLDNDTVPDLIGYNADANALLWFKHMAPPDGTPIFEQRVIGGAPTANGKVAAGDLNGDGLADVVLATPTGLRWFRNSTSTPGMFTPNLFTFNLAGPSDVSLGFVNADSLRDVIVSFAGGQGVAWYENTGGGTPFFSERIVTSDAGTGFTAVRAADLDADGDTDIGAGASSASTMFWFEQGLPEFALRRETVDGGGGASFVSMDGFSGFLVRGTIGQHDAGGSAGGGYEVRGGFWLSPFLTPCPGDTNGDRVIDFLDLNNVLSDFGMVGAGLTGDVDGDGDCDFIDLNIVLGVFGTQC